MLPLLTRLGAEAAVKALATSWIEYRRPRTRERCMAQAAFSGYCLGPWSLSQTPCEQQPLPLPKQVAAPRTSSGKSLRLQAHADNSQRAASKAQSQPRTVRKGFKTASRPHSCLSTVGCFAQSCSDNSQVPGNSHGAIPAYDAAAQVCICNTSVLPICT